MQVQMFQENDKKYITQEEVLGRGNDYDNCNLTRKSPLLHADLFSI
jgi:hypothetical protein